MNGPQLLHAWLYLMYVPVQCKNYYCYFTNTYSVTVICCAIVSKESDSQYSMLFNEIEGAVTQ